MEGRHTAQDRILSEIEGIARDKLDWNGLFHREMRLIEDLGLDSLRLLSLAVEVENRFHICLDEEDEIGIETVADLVAAVERKQGHPPAEPRPGTEGP